jgi:hypothetical protein
VGPAGQTGPAGPAGPAGLLGPQGHTGPPGIYIIIPVNDDSVHIHE